MIPKTGDVVVSRTLASREHEINIVPDELHSTWPTHDQAVSKGCELAERLHVDAWLTEDHIHFLHLSSYRNNR